MKGANRPVTSREYKLMLNVDRFADRKKGSQAFWDIVKFLVEKQGGKIVEKKKSGDVERRQTWYVDTEELALRRRGFIVRLREEAKNGKHKLTLKYRDSDRYLAADRDLSGPRDAEYKFEEDVLPPFVSKFSHSASFEKKKLPQLSTMADLVALFPGLGSLGVGAKTKIVVVNGFRANEVAHKIGKIEFAPQSEVKACLSFWYLIGDANERPLVGEFSFDYDVENAAAAAKGDLEQFPAKVVDATNHFFEVLQKQQGWIDFNGTTKTAYAYDAF